MLGFITTTLPGLAVVLDDGPPQFGFRHVLNAFVDGQRRLLARLRVGEHDAADHPAAHVGDGRAAPGLPAQVVIEALLDSGVALLFVVDAADHVRRQHSLRIEAAALAAELHPVEIEAADALRLLGRDLALDPEEPAVGSAATAIFSQQFLLVRA